MRSVVVVLFAAALATTVSGQWLEKTIHLPDSAGGALWPEVLAYVPTHNTVYIGGRSLGLSVRSAETGDPVAFVPCGGEVSAICYLPAVDKVYIASGRDDLVTVVDAGTNQVLVNLEVARWPIALCAGPDGNRVYCASLGGGTVTVIDALGDSMLATIGVPGEPEALCSHQPNGLVYCASSGAEAVIAISDSTLEVKATIPVGMSPCALVSNPHENKVFCANADANSVSVINGATNEVENEVPVGALPRALCYNSIANTMFCANEISSNVFVLDGAGNRVIAAMVVGPAPVALAFDPVDNRMYSANSEASSVTVMDGAENRVLGDVTVGEAPRALCYNPADNRILCACGSSDLAIIDCPTNTLAALRRVGATAGGMVFSSDRSRLYAVCDSDNGVAVIDLALRRPVKYLPVGTYPWHLCYNTANDKLYCTNVDDSIVTVIDALADTVAAVVHLTHRPEAIAYAAAANKVYVSEGYHSGMVSAIDGAGDTVVAVIVTRSGGIGLCANETGSKVYVAGQASRYVSVIDCTADTVLKDIEASECIDAMLYNGQENKLYALEYAGDGNLTIIDAAADTVVAQFPVGNGGENMCLNPVDNKVYVSATCDKLLGIVDGHGDSLIGAHKLNGYTRGVAYDSLYDCVYCCHENGIAVVSGTTNRVVADVPVPGAPGTVVANSANGRVYAADGDVCGILVIVAGAGAVKDHEEPAGGSRFAATLVRGCLVLPETAGEERSAVGAQLLDISGRKVLDLRSGPNDVGELAPGVYFVHLGPSATGRKSSAGAVLKVVIQR